MMTNPGYLFAGFALAWGLALGYLWFLSRRSDVVQLELEILEERLKQVSPQEYQSDVLNGDLRQK